MRLDKLISSSGLASRSEISKAVRAGRVTLNGESVKSPSVQVDPCTDRVVYCGKTVEYREHIYIMLNKPEGYISAREDKNAPVVTELLAEADAERVHPCGRLDKYTIGMMILTDDGEMSHRLLSPQRHVPKKYRFTCAFPLGESERVELECGVHIEGGYLTKPCIVGMVSDKEGYITIKEGKYHQIKQMLYAVGNRIVTLERVSFGPLALDTSLERGEWRYLSDEEVQLLKLAAYGE